jgi:Golgi phosphoprotein 3
MILSLSEELLLLALHDEKGSVIFSSSTALPYGLVGTTFLELLFKKRIELREKKLKCLDSTPLGNPILDEVLALISSSKKVRTVKYWITKIDSRVKRIRQRITDDLVHKGTLRREKYKVLGLFPAQRFPTQSTGIEFEIRNRIRNVVLFDHKPSEREVALISLVKVCGLVNEVFEREERKQAKARIKELSKDEVVGKMVSEVVAQMTVAINSAITASTAASAAAS